MGATAAVKPAKITRETAIDRIRRALISLVDDEHSACEVAAARGILCHGFARFTDQELRERYDWLARKGLSRAQIEDLANRWQLARQVVHDAPLSCDVQAVDKHTCRGFDEATNQDLSRYYKELLGTDVVVV